jgi:hypothetical protein
MSHVRQSAPTSFLLAGLLAIAGSCSSGSAPEAVTPPPGTTCPAVGYKACPNDIPSSQSDIDQCQSWKDDASCGGMFVTYVDCFFANSQCTSSGHIDGAGTQARCASQKSAWQSCQSGTTPGCGALGVPATAACETCLDTNCCAAKMTCVNNPDCIGLIQCVSICTGATCEDCYTLFPNGLADVNGLCSATGQPCETACGP